jgi:hypothetical protein
VLGNLARPLPLDVMEPPEQLAISDRHNSRS